MSSASGFTRRDGFDGAFAAAMRQADRFAELDRETARSAPTHGAPAPGAPADDGWPSALPGYTFVREIHRGGQGVVFQAVHEPSNRDVAVKVLREGAAGPRERMRFEQEVEILRELKHPNLVAIHDLGVVAGRQYLVMPYIEGRPLDRYLAECDLSLRQTLDLFARICDAVNAAHLNGVIHRDLKPGNILVDDAGTPYVVDFGLAKLVSRAIPAPSSSTDNRQLTTDNLTQTGQFVGSLPWASPEQAEGASRSIDVRSDVYSLGVILYQLLTGRFPYDVTGSMRDVLNRIVGEEPARPRARAVRSSLDPSIPRSLDPFSVDDELETIVLKCLSKDPPRRYQSAGDLAADIHHYLAGEPIDAKRDSAWYVMRKQLWRYRLSATIALSFVLLVTVGFVVAFAFWQSALRERDRAESANTHLYIVLDELSTSLTKTSAAGHVRDMLHKSVATYVPNRNPRDESEVRLRFSILYLHLGELENADVQAKLSERAARRVPSDKDGRLGRVLQQLAAIQNAKGNLTGAHALHREAAKTYRVACGETSIAYIKAAMTAADAGLMTGDPIAESEKRAALDLAERFLPDGEFLAQNQRGFGEWLFKRHRYDEGLAYGIRAFEWARRAAAPGLLDHFLFTLGNMLTELRRFDEAEEYMRECVELRASLYPDADMFPAYLLYVAQGMLGEIRTELGCYAEAEEPLLDSHDGFYRAVDQRWSDWNAKLRPKSLERLARLYELWDAAEPGQGYAEKAAEWRAKPNETTTQKP